MNMDFIVMIRSEIKSILEETFVLHHGAYTDKGTSLSETLKQVDFEKASRILPGIKETIAGHVYHLIFYIKILKEYITDIRSGKTDWNESWVITKVSYKEWESLKSDLLSEYNELMVFIDSVTQWDKSDYFGGVLAIIAHCAYHLGAIRQLIEM